MFHDIQGHHTESAIPLVHHELNVFQEKIKDFVSAVREGKPAPIPESRCFGIKRFWTAFCVLPRAKRG